MAEILIAMVGAATAMWYGVLFVLWARRKRTTWAKGAGAWWDRGYWLAVLWLLGAFWWQVLWHDFRVLPEPPAVLWHYACMSGLCGLIWLRLAAPRHGPADSPTGAAGHGEMHPVRRANGSKL